MGLKIMKNYKIMVESYLISFFYVYRDIFYKFLSIKVVWIIIIVSCG